MTAISLRTALDLPWWVKALAAAALLAALYAAFAWWRASVVQEGWDSRDLTAKVEIADLTAAIREQNRAVEAMGAAAKDADDRRKLAEGYAARIVKSLDRRAAGVASSTATNCDGVMRDAWEAWK